MIWVLAAIAALFVLLWLGRGFRTGPARASKTMWALLGGAAAMAVARQPLAAILLLGLAGAVYWMPRAQGRGAAPTPQVDQDLIAARRLLGVAAGADEEAIRQAWRRKITALHPDRGGQEAAAAKLNAARDLLLARLKP